MDKEQLKKQYFKSKEQLSVMRDEITLNRWKILSRANKIGKRIWRRRFTRRILSRDMDIPYTTTLRCLSLDKANKRTWGLIKNKKISVYKVAQICQSKCNTYQDDIVDLVIEENYSTYQITTLNIKNSGDISKERHRLACENGYSRKHSAYFNFNSWVDRGTLFLLMDKAHLPDDKIEDIENKLKRLSGQIGRYLKDTPCIKSANNLGGENNDINKI